MTDTKAEINEAEPVVEKTAKQKEKDAKKAAKQAKFDEKKIKEAEKPVAAIKEKVEVRKKYLLYLWLDMFHESIFFLQSYRRKLR